MIYINKYYIFRYYKHSLRNYNYLVIYVYIYIYIVQKKSNKRKKNNKRDTYYRRYRDTVRLVFYSRNLIVLLMLFLSIQ